MTDMTEMFDQIGGREGLEAILTRFYNRVFDDAMIGFLFANTDKQRLIEHQADYLEANLFETETDYTGTPIRKAHRSLPLLPGHFDRRHEILRQTLGDQGVPEDLRDPWLEFEQSLRDLIIQTGDQYRESILDSDS